LTINTAGGTMAVEGLYKGTSTWTPALTTVSPDGTTSQTAETAIGSYVFNCASMVAVRVDGSAASGTPSVTLNAGGGVNRILGAGVNGGRTIVAGNSPITVTNSGNTATISCTGCGAGPSPTPVSVQAGSGIAVATPSPGVFVISSTVTPSPTSTPVSVQAGSNVTVATPAPGVFVVSASTAAPPNITGAGAVTVATPAANTYVISAPTAAPPNITSANTNLTVATPAANTYVLTVVTPAPAPTVAITTTNLAVTNPSTNVFTLSTIGNYTAPITTPTYGCDSYTLASAGIYTINGSGYSCSASTSGSFVIPAIGSTVSVPVAAGFGIYQKYTPLTISDGTRQVAGLVSATTTATSTSVGLTVQHVNFGAVGNTVAAGAEIVTGGYDPGAGTVTSVTGTANTPVTGTAAAPVVNLSNNPQISGLYYAGTGGTSSDGDGVGIGATAGQYTYLSNCQPGVTSCQVGDVYGQALFYSSQASTYFVLDSSGDAAYTGYLELPNSLTAGKCVQAGTNGKLVSASGACGTGTGTISSITNTDGNLLITTPAGPTTTINTNQSPTYTGNTTIGTSGNYGDNGTGLGSLYLSSGGTGGKTQISTYNGSSNTLNGIKGQAIGIGPPVAGSFYWVLDSSGNASNLGSLYSGALAASSGFCLQATTNGKIQATGQGCSNFLLNIGFGYISGTVTTANDYPSQQVAGYTNGKITKLRVSCKGADNGTTVFTYTDSTTSTTIGTIAMANAAKTGTTTLGTPFTLTAGDQLTASVTTAGTATGCGLTAEGQASTF
jgi:hypothetical protein